MESFSSLDPYNRSRESVEWKQRANCVDLFLRAKNGEFGRCETGNAEYGEQGVKDKSEGYLKAPVLMKDIIWLST